MTVILTMIGKSCCIHATDSFITRKQANGTYAILEDSRPKYVPIPHFHGAISFMGMVTPPLPLLTFETYEWLIKKSEESEKYSSPASFAESIKNELNRKISSIDWGSEKSKTGMVIHFTAYEDIDGQLIPELFAIRNCKGINYQSIEEFGFEVYRSTFELCAAELNIDQNDKNHSSPECRKIVNDFLDQGGLLIFNNGDPWLCSPMIQGYSSMIKTAWKRNLLKNDSDIEILQNIAHKIIESIIIFQEEFFIPNYQIVGGVIHKYPISIPN